MLRDYQIETIKQIKTLFAKGLKRVIMCLPTGGGKTVVMAEMIKKMMDRGHKILFVVHLEELAFQAQEEFTELGLSCDIVMGKNKYSGHDLTIGSIQTLARRPFIDKDIIFIDECHHAISKTYLDLLRKYSNKYMIGASATPYRLDGKPLGKVFQEVVAVTSNKKLIQSNFLVSAKYFAAEETIDTSGVDIVCGDYNKKQLYEAANKKHLYANVVKNYKNFCPGGEQAVAFNINKDHSKNTAKEFVKEGISAMHLDGDTPKKQRREIIRLYKMGVYRVLCNCNLISEGFNLPSIHAVIINKTTKSRARYMQWIGRALRPASEKNHAIVIDQGDNVIPLGFAEDDFFYDIHKPQKKRKPGDAPVKICTKCRAIIYASFMKCPNCGYEYSNKEIALKESEFREIVRVDFSKIKKPLPIRLRKPYTKMTDSELREVQILKRYKPGWVHLMQKMRDGGI